MISKWLLVSLLALGVQNISAGNTISNFIDVTKFNMVFYDPMTQLSLKGALENIGRGPFSGVGFRGVKCDCEGLTCGCCSGINVTTFNFNRKACTNFTYYPENLAIKLNFVLNDKEIVTSGVISANNPAPFCVPVYPPFMSFCVRLYDVFMMGRNLHACVDLEVLAVTWPVLVLHFDCIKIGADGISWMKPGDSDNFPQMVQMGIVMPEVNGPEIYDQVNFETDPVELLNDQTLSMTPEEENNIGQLKL
ncbi:PREDICTED: uncharacterized protein LOC105568904 [Vollenhovia emeryi]|uniref:uncharacterized protein LOC105568904 n=1 Tax=Vollenhovia emeryi TaxID=411798 RepID=UPI0005F4C655|nr:PREDICTED: uncharacterized protein LOC105568904 [Vollenhovia emeryi]